MQQKWCRRLLAVLVAGGSVASAQASDFPVVVACGGWQAEFAAQVEARIRTTLLAEGLDAHEIGIACAPDDSVSVRVVSSAGELTRPVVRRSGRIEDDVVGAVEAALTELLPTPGPGASNAWRRSVGAPPPAATPPATPPAAGPSASAGPSAPIPPPTAVPLVDIPPALATPPARVTELYLSPRGELWDGLALLGAEAGLSVAASFCSMVSRSAAG